MAALKPGIHVGSFEVVSLIGVGGMGEVYRARDLKLKRDVAIKVLPVEFAQDPERLARTQREAEVLASLNHSNIAQIHGLETHEGSQCLILEFVDGETLDERLKRGPIPIDEVIQMANQIVDAFGAAHGRGIVHRDLKPANVKVTLTGQVKVLDFGLAKALDAAPNQTFSQSPTLLTAGTAGGVILGTTAYMSPEQARGRQADTRSDIWAFGVVLFEMLTGKHAFPGDTVLEVLSSVLKSDVDWTLLPSDTPDAVRTLLRRCLQRDPAQRLHHILDARLDLEDALKSFHAPQGAQLSPKSSNKERGLWIAAVIVAAAMAAVLGGFGRSNEIENSETRLQLVLPDMGIQDAFAVSPDGHQLVFRSASGGTVRLWIRDLSSDSARPLEGTEGGAAPFWSPDGRSIGFLATGQLKRLDLAGGAPLPLAEATTAGSWGSGNDILFTRGANIFRVPAGGGPVVEAIRPTSGHVYYQPYFLPDGRHFLMHVSGSSEVTGIYLASLDGASPRKLMEGTSPNAEFVAPDRVVFARDGALLASRLDLANAKLAGDSAVIAPSVAVLVPNNSIARFSASSSTIIYRPGIPEKLQLTWYDRSGRQTGVLGQPDDALPEAPRISPNGQFVAMSRTVRGDSNVWVLDTARGIPNPVTSSPSRDAFPAWSPDSKSLAFHSNRKTGRFFDLFMTNLGSSGDDEVLLESPENKNMTDWSPDGLFILYGVSSATSRDLWALPRDGKPSFPIAQSPGTDYPGRFSPDGGWVAYQSDQTGASEIYVQAFPGPSRSQRLTNEGGRIPAWSRNGQEIIYLNGDDVMALPLSVKGAQIEARDPVKLFSFPRLGNAARPFDVSRDGERILALVPTEAPVDPPLNVILNWNISSR